MIEKISNYLDKKGIDDYEVVSELSEDTVNVYPDPVHFKVYIPEDLDYMQYEIDDFLRTLARTNKTKVSQERHNIALTTSLPLTQSQIEKLVEFIIKKDGFCTLLDL